MSSWTRAADKPKWVEIQLHALKAWFVEKGVSLETGRVPVFEIFSTIKDVSGNGDAYRITRDLLMNRVTAEVWLLPPQVSGVDLDLSRENPPSSENDVISRLRLFAACRAYQAYADSDLADVARAHLDEVYEKELQEPAIVASVNTEKQKNASAAAKKARANNMAATYKKIDDIDNQYDTQNIASRGRAGKISSAIDKCITSGDCPKVKEISVNKVRRYLVKKKAIKK